jgi:hypothetical protein
MQLRIALGAAEADPAGVMAQQQLHVQGTLEVGERGRHRRLGQVHLRRRAGDAAGLGDRDEILQLARRVLGHPASRQTGRRSGLMAASREDGGQPGTVNLCQAHAVDEGPRLVT